MKVHAPWEVLCTYAEVMHIKLPIQPNDLRQRKSAFNWFTKIISVSEDVIKPEQEFFTAPFEKDRLSDFYIKDRDSFFNSATRSRIVSIFKMVLSVMYEKISSFYYSVYLRMVFTAAYVKFCIIV